MESATPHSDQAPRSQAARCHREVVNLCKNLSSSLTLVPPRRATLVTTNLIEHPFACILDRNSDVKQIAHRLFQSFAGSPDPIRHSVPCLCIGGFDGQ